MTQKGNLLIGGVALVPGRLKNVGGAMVEICDELDPVLNSSGFFAQAPFRCVSLIIRFGLLNNTKPEYRRIIKKYSELPIAIELNMNELKTAGKEGRIKQVFYLATIDALIDVAKKYNLPFEPLKTKRDEVVSLISSKHIM